MTFYTDGALTEPEVQGIHELPLSTRAYVGESFAKGLEETPIAQIYRAGQIAKATDQPEETPVTDPMSGFVMGMAPAKPVEKMPIEEARRQIKEAGLERQLDLGHRTEIEKPVLDIMLDHARDRQHRDAQLARGPSGILPGVAATGANFFAGALDPLSLAAFSVPVAGEARMASLMASAGENILGRAAVRGGIGAAQGAVGMAAIQPVEALAHSMDGRDFGFKDALANIAAGAGLGGLLHVGGGAVSDIYRGLTRRPLYPFGPEEPFARTPAAPPGAPPAAPPPVTPPPAARAPGEPLPSGAFPQVEALLAHPEVRNQPVNDRLNFTLDDVLNTPSVAEAIEHPEIDREHDVPFGSAAGVAGTHIDQHVPAMDNIDGVSYNPAIPANIARQVEREAIERMLQQFRDEKGREPHDREVERIINFARKNFATPAEKAWVTARGIDWDKYQENWREWQGKIDHENPANPPSGMYATPLPPRTREKVAGGEAAPTELTSSPPAQAPPARPEVKTTLLESTEKGHYPNVIVQAEGGGELRLMPQPESGTLQIYRSDVPEGMRGQGRAIAMYERAIDYAKSKGLRVVSDAYVSPEARRVYEGLERRGYHIERHPNAFEKEGDGGLKRTKQQGEEGPIWALAVGKKETATPPPRENSPVLAMEDLSSEERPGFGQPSQKGKPPTELEPLEEAILAPTSEEPISGPAVNPATGTNEVLPPVEAQEVLKGAVASLIEGKPVRAGEQIEGSKAEPAAVPSEDRMSETGVPLPEGTVRKAGGWRVPITGPEGKEIGRLDIEFRSRDGQKAVQVRGAQIDAGERNKGYGIAAYQKLADYALRTGQELWSDRTVEPEAQQVYYALRRRGYTVTEQDPNAVPYDAQFKVTAGPTESPAAQPGMPEQAPAAPTSLSDHFRDYFLGSPDFLDKHSAYLEEGKRFATIVQARRFAKDMGFGDDPKVIDEAIEQGAVHAARAIAQGEGSVGDKFDELVRLYDRQPRLSTRTSTSMRDQAYSTPVPLAYAASRLGRVEPRRSVYEPSAGNGALLMEADPPNYAVANEINPERAKALEAQGFQVTRRDASDPAQGRELRQNGGVDVVLANPPFGPVRENGVSRVFDLSDIQRGYETHEIDHAIALRSLEAMKDDGRAVLLIGGINKLAKTEEARSDAYNVKAKREFFKVLFDRYNVTDHFTVAGELYERQGAGWPIDVLVVDGRGPAISRPLPGEIVVGYHGTEAEGVEPSTKFGGSRGGVPDEQGTVFFSSTERLAKLYGENVARKTIRLGKTVTFDVGELINDPKFIEEMRSSFERTATRNDYLRERAKSPEGQAAIEKRWQDVLNKIDEWKKSGHVRYDPALTGAIIQRARAEGLDTAVIKNMAEGHGKASDQIVVLNDDALNRAAERRPLPAVNPPRVLDSWDQVGKVLDEARRTENAGPSGPAAGGPPVERPAEPAPVLHAGGGAPVEGGGAAGGIAPEGRPEDIRVGPVPGEPRNVPAGPERPPAGQGQPELGAAVGDTGRPGGEPAAERPSLGVERIASSAVKFGDDIYTGVTHADAMEAASKATGKSIDELWEMRSEEGAKGLHPDGFMTNTGRYVTRKEATQIADAADQIDRQHPNYIEGKYLTAEYLKTGEATADQAAAEATKEALEPRPAPEAPAAEQPKVKPRVVKTETETGAQVAYTPQSGHDNLGTLVPVNMKKSTADSLESVERRRGNIDRFVADELGYSTDELTNAFAAEQVDALALALDNIKANKGFIIGDQTGIGKGRVNAGIIRWSIRNNRIPVFVTEKPNLYGDMYRDLTDIGLGDMLGREPRFLMTNAGEDVPLSEDGKIRLKTPPAAAHNAMMLALPHDAVDFLKEFDAVFTNYSQMQTVAESDTPRRAFLRNIAPDSVVIFDESHNAGGQKKQFNKGPPDRAAFARELVNKATGVFYSSATYAKRPDVMDLYSKTDMAMAVADPKDLGEAIAKGGVPMQQAVASMLARAGQYVRRERSFAGVEYNTPSVPVERATYDGISRSLNSINEFSKVVAKAAEQIDKDLKAQAGGMGRDASVGDAGARSTNFTSIMHNVVGQVLLAMKAKPAARMAIEALERGEKPVITVSGTMESFLKDFAENMDIKPGDPVTADFGHVLKKYLDRTRTLIIKKPFAKKGESERKYLSDAELGPMGVRAYDAAKEMIDKLDLKDLPISPIDAIKSELTKAGYSVGEITGRGTIIDYSGKRPILKPRPGAEVTIKGRRETISRFNGGPKDKALPQAQVYDAMILNQAGATGLSLHASERVADQRQRHMFIAQPEANIDTHMQLLGRIHRTGQVILPKYSQLIADIPAEKRPAAVLAKKMASLNANTTAARGSAMTAKDVPDFMNVYGDMVAAALIQENPELNARLGRPVTIGDNGKIEAEDAMRKMTGRIPLLPLKQQEELYSYLETEYNSLLEQMKAAGENALEAQTLDLRAQTVERREVVARKQESDSPFAAPVQVERVLAKKLGKPFKSDEVVSKILEGLGEKAEATVDNAGRLLDGLARRAEAKQQEQAKEVLARFETYKRGVLDEIDNADRQEQERAKQDGYKDRWAALQEMLPPGQRVVLKTANGNMTGVVLKVEQKGKPKNPVALSTWKADIAIADATKRIELPFSRLYQEGTSDPEDALAIEIGPITDWLETKQKTLDRFDSQQSDAREDRYIATGNLLAAYDWLNRKGRIVNYTDAEGHTRQGILTPRDFDFAEHAATKRTPIGDEKAVMGWLRENPSEWLPTQDNNVEVSYNRYRDSATISAAGAKRLGGTYYLDKKLTDTIGRDFVKRGNKMVAEVRGSVLEPAIARIQELGGQFVAVRELPPAETAGAARPAPEMTREEAWKAMASEPLPHEERAAVDASRAAETAEEPVSAAEAPKERQAAAAAAEQSTAAQVAQAGDYISDAERADMDRAIQDYNQEQVTRAQVIREGIACLTVGGFGKEKP